MSAINPRQVVKRPNSQSGTTAIEFALVAMIFFTFVFGVIEVSRLLYVINTLQEVTRRAAAAAVHVDPRDETAIATVKWNAVFLKSHGNLAAAPPVTDQHIQLDYLRWDLSVIPTTSLPNTPAENRKICMLNRQASNCIQFVEARICVPNSGSDCQSVQSQMLLPLIDLRIRLPKAPTISMIETLGYVAGTLPPGPPPCECP